MSVTILVMLLPQLLLLTNDKESAEEDVGIIVPLLKFYRFCYCGSMRGMSARHHNSPSITP